MKHFVILISFLIIISTSALAADYSSAIEDLPLMPGMSEVTDNTVVFDNPGGRIVETDLMTSASPETVNAFYRAALPPLGWTAVSATVFTRDNEKLTMESAVKDGRTHVHFNLTPKD